MKFKSFALTIAVLLLVSMNGFAQGEINRIETYIGYSHNRVDNGITSNDPDIHDFFAGREGANGVNGSVTGNVSKWVGITGDVAYHTKTNSGIIGGDPFSVKYQNTTLMGGVQFKNNLKDGPTVRPFAHVLAGLAHQKISVTSPNDNADTTDNSFTMAFGGGLDIRVHRNVDIRVIQFDYTPVFRNSDTIVVDNTTVPPTTITFSRQDSFRIGFGIVIH